MSMGYGIGRARPRPDAAVRRASRWPTTSCSGTASRSPALRAPRRVPGGDRQQLLPGAGRRATPTRTGPPPRSYDALHNRLFTDPCCSARYPDARRARRPGGDPRRRPGVSAAPIDVLGVNYYNPTGHRRGARGGLAAAVRHRAARRATRVPRSAGRWSPDGLRDLLLQLHAAVRRRAAADPDHRERLRVRRRAGRRRPGARPGADRLPRRAPPRRARGDGRRACDVTRLLRLVAAGQLRVGRGLHQAVRPGARRLRHAAADAEGRRTPGSADLAARGDHSEPDAGRRCRRRSPNRRCRYGGAGSR